MLSKLGPDQIPGKLLLAGEFTVLTGGSALAFPLDRFYGQWSFKPGIPDPGLIKLSGHLKRLGFLDYDRIEAEFNAGWIFDSNIPQGYGLGSSGALSAAILKRYATGITADYKLIQKSLAEIEQYYHGTSSGFDPLISYTRQAFIVKDHRADPVDLLRSWGDSEVLKHFFLVDSNIARGSISSIDWFYDQYKNLSFRNELRLLEQLNLDLIQAILLDNVEACHRLMQAISALQLQLFTPLIVPDLAAYWQKGLDTNDYYIKLCGKGGGGYYLIWSIKALPSDVTAVWLQVF